MQCLSKLFQVLVKLISNPFTKQHFEYDPAIGAMWSSFRRVPCTQPSINFASVTSEIYQ